MEPKPHLAFHQRWNPETRQNETREHLEPDACRDEAFRGSEFLEDMAKWLENEVNFPHDRTTAGAPPFDKLWLMHKYNMHTNLLASKCMVVDGLYGTSGVACAVSLGEQFCRGRESSERVVAVFWSSLE